MSAADLVTLGRALAAFPEVMEWAKTFEAPFRDGALQMRNTNYLVRTFAGAGQVADALASRFRC